MIVTPKQRSPERSRDWYPYYAGYTEEFVDAVLTGPLRGAKSVLDPWSGTGTTTVSCAQRGVRSAGIDINPALTVVANARLTPRSTSGSLLPLSTRIGRAAKGIRVEWNDRDLLETWMRPNGVTRIRCIQEAIHETLTSTPARPTAGGLAEHADRLPVLASFFYTALFATVRDLLGSFQSTNPTWLRSPASARNRLDPSWTTLLNRFEARARYFQRRLSIDDGWNGRLRSFRTASATNIPFSSQTFEGALTSPPYATRIDYVRGSLPELAVLGADSRAITELRATSTGSPVVRGAIASASELMSQAGKRLLRQIRAHRSKGSPAYYWPWMANYLDGLQGGLSEVRRVVRHESPICVVVQDSHYKEIHVDLQRIVIEIMDASGRRLTERFDYPVGALRSRMNPRARVHLRTRHATESLLVFT